MDTNAFGTDAFIDEDDASDGWDDFYGSDDDDNG